MGDVDSVASIFICISEISNIWYVSDDGSDDNDCHSASTPCRNLQTVLDRATDGAQWQLGVWLFMIDLTMSVVW